MEKDKISKEIEALKMKQNTKEEKSKMKFKESNFYGEGKQETKVTKKEKVKSEREQWLR